MCKTNGTDRQLLVQVMICDLWRNLITNTIADQILGSGCIAALEAERLLAEEEEGEEVVAPKTV